jgi:hypothetical protein
MDKAGGLTECWCHVGCLRLVSCLVQTSVHAATVDFLKRLSTRLQEESINWGTRHDDDLQAKDRDLEVRRGGRGYIGANRGIGSGPQNLKPHRGGSRPQWWVEDVMGSLRTLRSHLEPWEQQGARTRYTLHMWWLTV